MAVVRLRGELDFPAVSELQAYLGGVRARGRPRAVADLTDLAYIDCACLSVLVRHCTEIREQGGSFALAGPQGAVHRILAVTGLLGWFEVHETVEGATASVSARRPRLFAGSAVWHRDRPALAAAGRDGVPVRDRSAAGIARRVRDPR